MSDREAHLTSSRCVAADGLVVVATALMGIGLVAVASTSASLDQPLIRPGFFGTTLGRQVLFVVVGVFLMAMVSRLGVPALRSPWFRTWAPRFLFVIALAGLVATMIPALTLERGGSARWLRIDLGGSSLGVQPSELAKLAMVMLLGSLLAHDDANPRSLLRGFVPAAAIVGAMVLLVGREDFGTAALLGCVGGAMLLVGGCRLWHLSVMTVLGGCVMTVLLFAEKYRLDRITAFMDVQADPGGAGYQPLQSLATVASGGWAGTGLGLGVQKYGYLPACHTDFIFAVICEEMGALGGALVIVLYAAFVWLGLRAMWQARTRFERLVAFGLTATLGLQAAMNLAVVTVLAPTTGISLPLISAGGSGLLTFSLVTGLLAAIAIRGADVASPARVAPGSAGSDKFASTGEAEALW